MVIILCELKSVTTFPSILANQFESVPLLFSRCLVILAMTNLLKVARELREGTFLLKERYATPARTVKLLPLIKVRRRL